MIVIKLVRMNGQFNNHEIDEVETAKSEKYKVHHFLMNSHNNTYAICQQISGNNKGMMEAIQISNLKVIQDNVDEVDISRLEYLNEVMSVIKNK